jgi:hypothetical protein
MSGGLDMERSFQKLREAMFEAREAVREEYVFIKTLKRLKIDDLAEEEYVGKSIDKRIQNIIDDMKECIRYFKTMNRKIEKKVEEE